MILQYGKTDDFIWQLHSRWLDIVYIDRNGLVTRNVSYQEPSELYIRNKFCDALLRIDKAWNTAGINVHISPVLTNPTASSIFVVEGTIINDDGREIIPKMSDLAEEILRTASRELWEIHSS